MSTLFAAAMGQSQTRTLFKTNRARVQDILQDPIFTATLAKRLFDDEALSEMLVLRDDESGAVRAGDEHLGAFSISPEKRIEVESECERGRDAVDARIPGVDDPLERLKQQLRAAVPTPPGHEAAYERRFAVLEDLMVCYASSADVDSPSGVAPEAEGLGGGFVGLPYGPHS